MIILLRGKVFSILAYKGCGFEGNLSTNLLIIALVYKIVSEEYKDLIADLNKKIEKILEKERISEQKQIFDLTNAYRNEIQQMVNLFRRTFQILRKFFL